MKYNKTLFLLSLLTISLLLTSCGSDEADREVGTIVDGYMNIGDISLDQVQLPQVGEEILVINTNKGSFKIRLFEDVTPGTVAAVKEFVNNGFYDGLLFSRIEEDFLIQVGIPDYKVEEEQKVSNEYFREFHEDYRHYNGAIALAHDGREGLAFTGSFYIISNDEIEEDYLEAMKDLDNLYPEEVWDTYDKLGGIPRLDMQFAVFGQVFYGMDVVMEINKIPLDEMNGQPTEEVIIESMKLDIFQGQ